MRDSELLEDTLAQLVHLKEAAARLQATGDRVLLQVSEIHRQSSKKKKKRQLEEEGSLEFILSPTSR